jgi:hypothetical protein
VLRAAASNPCVSSTQCYFALRFLLNGKRIYAFMVAHLEKNKPLPNRCRRHRWMRHSPGIARAARPRAPRRCRTVATVRQDPAVFLSIQCQSRRDNYRHPILRKVSIEDGVGRARWSGESQTRAGGGGWKQQQEGKQYVKELQPGSNMY